MDQEIQERHETDEQGRPAGGVTSGEGILIRWQNGPLGRGDDRKKPNGAFVEGVIAAAIGRLAFYETTEFRCPENASALSCLVEASSWLQRRRRDREARGIEGTHTV